jgi:hypothetical protein
MISDDGTEIRLNHAVQSKHLCAACVLIFALLNQTVSALDPSIDESDAPSALRISSIIAILIYASPQLRGFSRVDHRLFSCVLIGLLALYGENSGGLATRTGDTLYSGIVLLLSLRVFANGGIEHADVRPDSYQSKNSPVQRDSVAAFCSGLLFYVGIRGFRQSWFSPQKVVEFKTVYSSGNESTHLPGYAHSSTGSVVPLAFGYGICVAISVLTGLKSSVSFEVGVCAMVILVAALWANLGLWEQFDALYALYGSGACSAHIDLCEEAFRARRFAMLNTGVSALWVAALGVCVFSFAPERRLDYAPASRSEKRWRKNGFTFGLITLAASLLACWTVTVLEGAQWHTDLAVMASLLGVFVSFFSDPLTGTIIYALVSAFEEVKLAENYGMDGVYVHFTHVTIAFSVFLISLHALVTIVKELLLCYNYKSSAIDHALGVVATFGSSLTFGLYLASALLLSGTNGLFIEDLLRDNSGKRTLLSFIGNHFIPFFAWLPLYASRSEVQVLGPMVRATAWLVSLPLVFFVYYIVLSFMNTPAPALNVVDMAPSVCAGVVGLVAWTTAAFV